MGALNLAIGRWAERLPGWRPALTDLRGWVVPLLLLALLETLVRSGVLPAHQMPAPSQVAQTLYLLAQSGELWRHLSASLLRVGAGFAIGAALAIVIGTWVGLSRRAEAYLEPTFQALRAIPSLAWVPLLLWLGIDETPKIVLIALGAFFPVYLALLAGIRGIDRKLVEVGQLHGLTSLTLIRRILLPASLPSLFTGLRGALSLSWMFLVAAELIAATRGLGYLLSDGRETSRPDLVIAAILLLALLGKLSDSLLKAWENRALSWRDSYQGGEGGA